MLYYTTAVDLWFVLQNLTILNLFRLIYSNQNTLALDRAFGCVISQMYLRQLLFQGGSELDMIFNLIQVMGSPDEQTLPGFENSQFGSFMTLRAETKCNLKSKLKHLKTSEYKLIEALLTYDSNKRKEAFDLLPEYLNHEPARKSLCTFSF